MQHKLGVLPTPSNETSTPRELEQTLQHAGADGYLSSTIKLSASFVSEYAIPRKGRLLEGRTFFGHLP